MRSRGGAKGLVVHGTGVATSATGEARGQEVARRTAKVLVVATAGVEGVARVERAGAAGASGARSTSHGGLSHVVLRRVVHGRGIARVGNDSSTGAAGSASETADVLGKVVVATDFVAALPVTSAEGNDTAAATPTAHTAAMAHVAVASVVGRRHHLGRTVAAAAAAAAAVREVISGRAGTGSGERASEAGCSSLEVGEAAGGAGPVAGARAILAGGERSQDILCAIEDPARRRRNLDGLFVEGPAIHAKALGSLNDG